MYKPCTGTGFVCPVLRFWSNRRRRREGGGCSWPVQLRSSQLKAMLALGNSTRWGRAVAVAVEMNEVKVVVAVWRGMRMPPKAGLGFPKVRSRDPLLQVWRRPVAYRRGLRACALVACLSAGRL